MPVRRTAPIRVLAVGVESSALAGLSRDNVSHLLQIAWADTPAQAMAFVSGRVPDITVLGLPAAVGDSWGSLVRAVLSSSGAVVLASVPGSSQSPPDWLADARVRQCAVEDLPPRLLALIHERTAGPGSRGADKAIAHGWAEGGSAALCARILALPGEFDGRRALETLARELREVLSAEAVRITVSGTPLQAVDPHHPPLPGPAQALEAIARQTHAVLLRPAGGANVLVSAAMVASGREFGTVTVLASASALEAVDVPTVLKVIAGALGARLQLAQERRDHALALRDAQAVYDSARDLVTAADPDEVLRGILRAVMRHVPVATAAALYLVEDEGGPWSRRASAGEPDALEVIESEWRLGLADRLSSASAPVLTPARPPGSGESAAQLGVALAGCPLMLGTQAIGAVVLATVEPLFSERDLRVLTTVVGQGALAVENTRLQSQAQMADEIAVLYELGQALNSDLDLQATVTAVLSTARNLASAGAAEVRLTADDGATLESVFTLGEPPDSTPGDRYRLSVLYPQSVLKRKQPLLVPDVGTSSLGDDFSRREPSSWLAAYLGVPLIAAGRVIAVLSLGADRVGAFTADDLRLLEIVASQAATALRNARLHQETIRSLREAEAVAAVSRSVASSLDHQTVLQAVTAALADSLPLARFSFSYLVGPSGTPSLAASSPPDASEVEESDAGIWQWCADGCLVRGEPVVVDDTLSLGFPSHGLGSAHSVVAVPMVAAGKTVGVLGVDSILPNAFTNGDLRLVRTMADQAATAVESATLYHDLEGAYQELRESTQTLSAVFDGITDGIYIVDRDDTIVAINDPEARFLGERPEGLIGGSYAEHYHTSEGKCEHCAVHEALDRGEHVSCIVSYADRRQQPVWREIDAYPIRDEEGLARRVVVFARDVTERRRLEATLAESSRMASVGQLASSIAHEVNNPLTVIIGNAEVMLLDADPDDPNTDTIRMIHRAANRAARTIQNLLDLSSQPDDDVAEFGVQDTIEEALELLAHPLRKAGISLVTDFAEDIPRLNGSASLLKTVWMSIVMNARDAIVEANGAERVIEVRVGQSESGDEVCVSISDTGVGIKPSQRERLFQPFYTTKRAGEALGLGLYNAHAVVREHGGRIEVDSTPGEGSIFLVYLPVDAGAQESAEAP